MRLLASVFSLPSPPQLLEGGVVRRAAPQEAGQLVLILRGKGPGEMRVSPHAASTLSATSCSPPLHPQVPSSAGTLGVYVKGPAFVCCLLSARAFFESRH